VTAGRASARDVQRLAALALPVLAAEPLYLLVDTAVVGRLGAVPPAALAVAIAAQSLVGASLGSAGSGGAARARGLAAQVTRYGLVLGCGFGVLFAALIGVLPQVFTTDAAVLVAVPVAWWFFVVLQPVAGVVFAIDGVLPGAGDAAFLRTSTLAAAVLGFLPLVWASLVFGWGPGDLVGPRGVHAAASGGGGPAGPVRPPAGGGGLITNPVDRRRTASWTHVAVPGAGRPPQVPMRRMVGAGDERRVSLPPRTVSLFRGPPRRLRTPRSGRTRA